MRPIRALYLATILAAGACAQDPTLEITVDDGGGSQMVAARSGFRESTDRQRP